jgi:ABC-type branched-subunit amino acid transport system substrate-binding protein
MKALTRLFTGSLLGLLLLAASCYGSTPPVVKLGLLAPFEELNRTDGYAVLPAVQLAISQRNAAGGVAGRQVALVALNDNGRPEEAQRQAANLAVDADVLAVIGPVHAATGAAAGPVLANQGLPWISLASLAADQQPSGFALEAQPAQWVQRATDLLRADGVADPLVVSNDGRFLIDSSSPQSPAGVVWLGDAAGGAELAGQLSPDVLLVGGPELGSAVFAGRAGSASAGVRWLSAGPASDSLPAGFVAAYQELAGAPPTPQAVLAYDAANLLLDAIALAGQDRAPVSRQTVLQALAGLGEAGWQGLSGAVVWQSADCPVSQPCWLRIDPPLVVHQW